MSTDKVYWVGSGVLVIGDVEVRFGQEIPVIKGFDVTPFLKSGKASRTKPAIESEVVKGLEERFIALRAENERLVGALAEADVGAFVALRQELAEAASAHEKIVAALEAVSIERNALQETLIATQQELEVANAAIVSLQQEIDDAKAMIAALTPQVGATPEAPVVPTIPGAAGPKAGK